MYFVVIYIFQIICIPFFFINQMIIILKAQNSMKRKVTEMVVQYNMQPQMANLDKALH